MFLISFEKTINIITFFVILFFVTLYMQTNVRLSHSRKAFGCYPSFKETLCSSSSVEVFEAAELSCVSQPCCVFLKMDRILMKFSRLSGQTLLGIIWFQELMS